MKILACQCILVGLFVLVAAAPAHAYLDPGSTSSILYVLLAFLAGVASFAKIYWSKLKNFFSKKKDN